MDVVKIANNVAAEVIRQKHYSRRKGMTEHSFALVANDAPDAIVLGVVTYGQAPLQVKKHVLGGAAYPVLELTRLVVQTEEKNAASILVGRSLAKLPSPCCVVSYADTEFSHCGVVYQATNWIYTGGTKSHDALCLVNGVRTHPRSLASQGITAPRAWAKAVGVEVVEPYVKHRYVFLVGSKYDKRAMRELLTYPVVSENPKSDQRRYDAGEFVPITVRGDMVV